MNSLTDSVRILMSPFQNLHDCFVSLSFSITYLCLCFSFFLFSQYTFPKALKLRKFYSTQLQIMQSSQSLQRPLAVFCEEFCHFIQILNFL